LLIQAHQYVEEQGLDADDLALFGQDSENQGRFRISRRAIAEQAQVGGK
jgi:hypothetical protein